MFRGTYTVSGSTDQGIRLIGFPSSVSGTLRVENLPAGESFVMSSFNAWTSSLTLDLVNNAGHVHLQELRYGPFETPVDVRASACRSLTVHQCMLNGTPALSINACQDASITDSNLRGFVRPPIGCPSTGYGLATVDSTVIAAHTSIGGGGGAYTFQCGTPTPTPGLSMLRSSMTIMGDNAAVGGGGAGTLGNITYAHAIVASGGTLTIDPAVQLVSGLPTPIASVGTQIVYRHIPTMLADPVNPAGVLEPKLRTVPGTPALVAATPPTLPVATPFGSLWLDPAGLIVLGLGVVPPSGELTLSLQLNPAFQSRGTSWALQSAVWNGSALGLSTPVHVTLR